MARLSAIMVKPLRSFEKNSSLFLGGFEKKAYLCSSKVINV